MADTPNPPENTRVFKLFDRQGECASYDFTTHQWTMIREPSRDLSNITGVLETRTMSRAEFHRNYPE